MEIPETMKAVEIAEPGGPEVLRLTERPVPRPGPGEVLVKVAAAGVNRPDVLQRMGLYPPPAGASDIPGLEIAGLVVDAGEGAEQAVGGPVCALVTGGGPEPVDFGFVGDVVGVNGELIALLVKAGFVPVLACLGADPSGGVFNINADAVANQVAIRLDARALVLVTDVPGVLRDVKDPASRIEKLTIAEGERAIAEGVVTKGMIPKLEEAMSVIDQGVGSIHILGKLSSGDLVRAVREPGSVGTTLVP